MRLLRISLTCLILTAICGNASAQFSISKVTPHDVRTKDKIDTVKNITTLNNKYFSESRFLAEKRALRKKRNTIEFNGTLAVTQTQFANWATGGDNTFSGRGALYFRHQYTHEKFSFDYKFDLRYGLNVIDDLPFKNEDLMLGNATVTWKLNQNWSYAASANFRSQFSKGYKSRTSKTVLSDFMAPGTLDILVGMTYRRPKSPLTINISPIGGSQTFVYNTELSKKGSFGVPKGDRSKSTLGSSFKMEYDKVFPNKIFRFRSSLYTFSNYRDNTYSRFENNLEIRALKFLTVNLIGIAVYDQFAVTPTKKLLQYNYILSIGLSYKYKNK